MKDESDRPECIEEEEEGHVKSKKKKKVWLYSLAHETKTGNNIFFKKSELWDSSQDFSVIILSEFWMDFLFLFFFSCDEKKVNSEKKNVTSPQFLSDFVHSSTIAQFGFKVLINQSMRLKKKKEKKKSLFFSHFISIFITRPLCSSVAWV